MPRRAGTRAHPCGGVGSRRQRACEFESQRRARSPVCEPAPAHTVCVLTPTRNTASCGTPVPQLRCSWPAPVPRPSRTPRLLSTCSGRRPLHRLRCKLPACAAQRLVRVAHPRQRITASPHHHRSREQRAAAACATDRVPRGRFTGRGMHAASRRAARGTAVTSGQPP